MLTGTARFVSPHAAEVDTVDGVEVVDFDIALIATGSRPRIPEWCQPDGDRILTTRDCYPPKEFPRSVTIIGSGVTGVEFVHMFASFGAEVTSWCRASRSCRRRILRSPPCSKQTF